jgi:hypothetical protein
VRRQGARSRPGGVQAEMAFGCLSFARIDRPLARSVLKLV